MLCDGGPCHHKYFNMKNDLRIRHQDCIVIREASQKVGRDAYGILGSVRENIEKNYTG